MHPTHIAAAAALALLVAAPALAQTSTANPQAAPAAKAAPAAAPQGALIDINTAPKEQLDALPQIGSARADAIIKGRPYRGKNELVDKKIIPQNAYEAIKDRIIAHHKS
jgi:DNA uptake protein ComE-like DNA-binding protein